MGLKGIRADRIILHVLNIQNLKKKDLNKGPKRLIIWVKPVSFYSKSACYSDRTFRGITLMVDVKGSAKITGTLLGKAVLTLSPGLDSESVKAW